MLKWLVAAIEWLTFGACVVLAYLWIATQDGWYEPWTFGCGLVFGGLELCRRYAFREQPVGKEAPKAIPHSVEQIIPELDEKSLGLMSVFGRASYFSRPAAGQYDQAGFENAVNRLRNWGCLRFEVSPDGKLYAYHWTDLGLEIIRNFKYDHIAAVDTPAATLDLSDKAQELLINATQDNHGIIMLVRTTDGLFVQTNNRQFAESKDARSEAEWAAAVAELAEGGFVESDGDGTFVVTAKGHHAIESSEKSGVQPPSSSTPVLPPLAIEILQAAIADKTAINVVRYDGGLGVVAGNRQFDSNFDLAEAAQLEDAIKMLSEVGWINEGERDLYHVSVAGLEANRRLS